MFEFVLQISHGLPELNLPNYFALRVPILLHTMLEVSKSLSRRWAASGFRVCLSWNDEF
jgi:hypothetical protein